MKQRQTSELRKGRVDMPGARYFITCCTTRPENRLTDASVGYNIFAAWHKLETDRDAILACATIMPDHIHLLFELTGRLPVTRVVGKMKVLTLPGLKAFGVKWQANFFEHRLRSEEIADNYARYIFMNPYRSGLITRRDLWPYWCCGRNVSFNFIGMLDNGKYPPVEWMESDWESLGIIGERLGEEAL